MLDLDPRVVAHIAGAIWAIVVILAGVAGAGEM